MAPDGKLFRQGIYFKSFDHEYDNGRGLAEFTDDKSEALKFPDMAAALAFWNKQSTVRPLRPDGKPNKPMTATTVDISRWEDA